MKFAFLSGLTIWLGFLALSQHGLAEQSTLTWAYRELTIQGSLLCNGACHPDPKPDDRLMVLYAIDGTPDIRAPGSVTNYDGSVGETPKTLRRQIGQNYDVKKVRNIYLPDQGNDVRGNVSPAGFGRTTLPPPKEVKTRSMPLDDGVWLKHSKRHLPSIPGAGEPDPECSVEWCEAGALGASVQDEQLVMQSQVFQQQVPAGFQRRGCEAEEQNQPDIHAVKDSSNSRRNPAFSTRMEFCQRQLQSASWVRLNHKHPL